MDTTILNSADAPELLALFLCCACTTAISAALCHKLIQLAVRFSILAEPTNDRWHKTATPFLGGIAIVFSLIFSLLVYYLITLSELTSSTTDFARSVLPLLTATVAIFALGLFDDFFKLRAWTKLLLESLIALVLLWTMPIENIPQETLPLLLSILWLVGITNAVNLLDNMDGLAGGIVAVCFISLAVFFSLSGNTSLFIVVSIATAAIVGFLMFNSPPAKIFMGDSGSLSLGFLLGACSLSAINTNNFGGVITPVLLLLIPLFDTTFVSINRLLVGKSIADGGRDHLSHRLVALGYSERTVVTFLIVIAALFNAFALANYYTNTIHFATMASLTLLVLLISGITLTKSTERKVSLQLKR